MPQKKINHKKIKKIKTRYTQTQPSKKDSHRKKQKKKQLTINHKKQPNLPRTQKSCVSVKTPQQKNNEKKNKNNPTHQLPR